MVITLFPAFKGSVIALSCPHPVQNRSFIIEIRGFCAERKSLSDKEEVGEIVVS
jgi:hypothetical protein